MHALIYRRPGARLGVEKRARHCVLAGLGTFALIQLVLALVIAHTWHWIRDPVHDTRLAYLQQQRRLRPKALEVAFLGTSRTQSGIQVPLLERRLTQGLGCDVVVHNWGTPSAGPVRLLMLWDRLERDGILPQVLCIEVMPVTHSPYCPFVDLDEAPLPTSELDAGDVKLLHRYDQRRANLVMEQWLGEWTPTWTYRLAVANRLARWWLPAEFRKDLAPHMGMRSRFDPNDRPKGIARSRQNYSAWLGCFCTGGKVWNAFDELLTRARKSGVRVALYVSAEGPAFRSWYPPAAEACLERHLAMLRRRHKIPVFDTRAWIDSEEEFLDSHHLTPEGADHYTTLLCDHCLVPILRGTRPQLDRVANR